MSAENKRPRKRRRSYFVLFRQFGYEIFIVLLLVVGGFLLVEKTDVSAILTNWIKIGFNTIIGGFSALVRQGYNYFVSFETSDIVGYMLILLAIHLMVLRGRKRLFREYDSVYKCPYCEHEKMQRAKRQFWHKLIGLLLILRIKNYECKACKKVTITFSRIK
ncbi:MAG: hypothetical protein H8E14_09145 [Candidatus Marinimicrobia bacterium]|nr:hypothetical protein [Candidatus Neomarinimicrobiota bacterium]